MVSELSAPINHYKDFETYPGVNFINILRTAFTLVDPESIKRD